MVEQAGRHQESARPTSASGLALIAAHADLESISRTRPRSGPGEAAPRDRLCRTGLRRIVVLAAACQALDTFIDESQRFVTGEVRLHPQAGVLPGSLVGATTHRLFYYDYGLAT